MRGNSTYRSILWSFAIFSVLILTSKPVFSQEEDKKPCECGTDALNDINNALAIVAGRAWQQFYYDKWTSLGVHNCESATITKYQKTLADQKFGKIRNQGLVSAMLKADELFEEYNACPADSEKCKEPTPECKASATTRTIPLEVAKLWPLGTPADKYLNGLDSEVIEQIVPAIKCQCVGSIGSGDADGSGGGDGSAPTGDPDGGGTSTPKPDNPNPKAIAACGKTDKLFNYQNSYAGLYCEALKDQQALEKLESGGQGKGETAKNIEKHMEQLKAKLAGIKEGVKKHCEKHHDDCTSRKSEGLCPPCEYADHKLKVTIEGCPEVTEIEDFPVCGCNLIEADPAPAPPPPSGEEGTPTGGDSGAGGTATGSDDAPGAVGEIDPFADGMLQEEDAFLDSELAGSPEIMPQIDPDVETAENSDFSVDERVFEFEPPIEAIEVYRLYWPDIEAAE